MGQWASCLTGGTYEHSGRARPCRSTVRPEGLGRVCMSVYDRCMPIPGTTPAEYRDVTAVRMETPAVPRFMNVVTLSNGCDRSTAIHPDGMAHGGTRCRLEATNGQQGMRADSA